MRLYSAGLQFFKFSDKLDTIKAIRSKFLVSIIFLIKVVFGSAFAIYIVILLVWCSIYKMEINVEQSNDDIYQNCLDPEKCRIFKGDALADLKVRLCYNFEYL